MLIMLPAFEGAVVVEAESIPKRIFVNRGLGELMNSHDVSIEI